MKWMILLGGFALYAVLSTLGARCLMLWHSPTHSSYGQAVAWLIALAIGVMFGFVGMCSGYYVYRKQYVGAAAISMVFTLSIAIVIATIWS